jgi:hypothetical protein
MGLIDDLRSDIDDILGVRDDLGAQLANVYVVTRTWDGDEIGAGEATEAIVQMLPTPRVVKLSSQQKMRDGGQVDSADIILKMVSRESYPEKSLIDGSTDSGTKEIFYEIEDELYRVIEVESRHVTWTIKLRKHSDQTRWPDAP